MEFKQDSWEFVTALGEHARDMLAALLDQSVDCVKVCDPDGRITFMNRGGRALMGFAEGEDGVGKAWPGLWPEAAALPAKAAVAAAREGRASRFEAQCPTARGELKWWDVTVTPVHDGDRALIAILVNSRDVTDRHTALDIQETISHEMRHRLRNAYAVGGAVALASGREAPEHAEFAADLAQRLNVLSSVQSSLIDPDETERLPALVRRIGDAFGGAGELVRSERLPDMELGEQGVRLLALVIGELAANSLKHGALGAGRPVDLSGTREDDVLILEWREGLSPKSDGAHKEGSGQRLMQRMAKVHGGRFETTFAADGLVARLELPVER